MKAVPKIVAVIVVHCIMPLGHKQMIAYLMAAAEIYRSYKGAKIVVPGGFADYMLEYKVGDEPVLTSEWLARQLVAMGVPPEHILIPSPPSVEGNVVDTSSEAVTAERTLRFPQLSGSAAFEVSRVIIPANPLHGRRIKRSWGAVQRRSGVKRPVEIVPVVDLMEESWRKRERRIVWWLWLWDPLCEKIPSRSTIRDRRSNTANIDRNSAVARTKSGLYDLTKEDLRQVTSWKPV